MFDLSNFPHISIYHIYIYIYIYTKIENDSLEKEIINGHNTENDSSGK